VSNPGVCFQVQYKLDPRYKRSSVHRLYVAAHCPFVLIKPESKQISHGYMHLYNISYTCEMSATVELCRSWTASRIIEPVWILCARSAVFYFCRASPYGGRVTTVGPSIKPQVHALVFTEHSLVKSHWISQWVNVPAKYFVYGSRPPYNWY